MTLAALLASLIPWLVPPATSPPPPPTASERAAEQRLEERRRVVELLSGGESTAERARAEERRRVVELLSEGEHGPIASGTDVVVRNGVPVASLDHASAAAAVASIDDEGAPTSASDEPVAPLPAPPLRRTVRVGPTQTVDGPLSLSATQVFLASSAVMPHKAPTLRVRGPESSIQLGLPVASLGGKDVLVDCVGQFPDELRVGVVWVSWDGAMKAWDAMVLSNLDERAKFVISPAGLPAKGKLWIQLRQGEASPESWEITECSVKTVR